jgi:hypothetical protein
MSAFIDAVANPSLCMSETPGAGMRILLEFSETPLDSYILLLPE